MKHFILSLFLVCPYIAFANTHYDCTVNNNPFYSSLQFDIDAGFHLISGTASFLGQGTLGLLQQTVSLQPTDLRSNPNGNHYLSSEAFDGHDGVDFMMTFKPDGQLEFMSSYWLDCVGYWNYPSAISCQITEP